MKIILTALALIYGSCCYAQPSKENLTVSIEYLIKGSDTINFLLPKIISLKKGEHTRITSIDATRITSTIKYSTSKGNITSIKVLFYQEGGNYKSKLLWTYVALYDKDKSKESITGDILNEVVLSVKTTSEQSPQKLTLGISYKW